MSLRGQITNEHIALRAFRPESDVPAVARLLTAVELVDWESEETSEANLRDQLDWPNHDPVRDRWVVEMPDESGMLAGYGIAWAKTPRYADVFVATHPSYRRTGIGSQLLARAVERARELKVERVGVYANTLNVASTAFLYAHGFQAVSSYWDLLATPDLGVPEPIWPPGYTTRNYDETRDFHLLIQTLNRSSMDLWGHGMATEDTVAAWLSTVPAPAILLVFGPNGDAAGICRFHMMEGEEQAGYIDAPGVVPEHRGADLYLPLLLTALQHLWSSTRFPVRLESWGDAPPVVAQYRAVGLSSIRHYIGFGLELAAY